MAGEDLARTSRTFVDHPERLFDQVKERVVAVEGKAVGCKDELLHTAAGRGDDSRRRPAAGAPEENRWRRLVLGLHLVGDWSDRGMGAFRRDAVDGERDSEDDGFATTPLLGAWSRLSVHGAVDPGGLEVLASIRVTPP